MPATAVVTLANNTDRILAEAGRMPRSAVRTVSLTVVVDPKAAIPLLPRAVVEQLGLTRQGPALVQIGSDRVPSDVVGHVKIEVFGREHVSTAIVAPDDRPATVGMIFLQSSDLIVDGEPPTLRPRDPEMIHTEIE